MSNPLESKAAELARGGEEYAVIVDVETNAVIGLHTDATGKTDRHVKGQYDSVMPAMKRAREVVAEKKQDGWTVTKEDWHGTANDLVRQTNKEISPNEVPDEPEPEPVETDFFKMEPADLARHVKSDLRGLDSKLPSTAKAFLAA